MTYAKTITRFLLPVFMMVNCAQAVCAQEYILPHPVYPPDALKKHIEGTGWVRVTFANYFQPPIKVEMAKSTGSPVLDFAVTDWVKRYWVVVSFTDEERRNPAAMNAKLKQYVPTDLNRNVTVEALVRSKPKPILFPVTKTERVTFQLR